MKYSAAGSAGPCFGCDRGYYCPGVGFEQVCVCVFCVLSLCVSFCRSHSSFRSHSLVLQPCPAGYYNNKTGLSSATSCFPCSAGTYSAPAATGCVTCLVSIFFFNFSFPCVSFVHVVCVFTAWFLLPGCAKSAAVLRGPLQLTRGLQLFSCVLGLSSFNLHHRRTAIVLWLSGTALCACDCYVCSHCACLQAGYYCPGAVNEQPCPSGTFGPSANAFSVANCTLCAAGMLCVFLAASDVVCVTGKANPNTAQTNIGNCVTCPAGWSLVLLSVRLCSSHSRRQVHHIERAANVLAVQPGPVLHRFALSFDFCLFHSLTLVVVCLLSYRRHSTDVVSSRQLQRSTRRRFEHRMHAVPTLYACFLIACLCFAFTYLLDCSAIQPDNRRGLWSVVHNLPAWFVRVCACLVLISLCSGSYTSTAGQSTCATCLAGSYCIYGAITPCPAGILLLILFEIVLICSSSLCVLGSWSSLTGLQSLGACTACPAGTANANTGSTSQTSCLACPAGLFLVAFSLVCAVFEMCCVSQENIRALPVSRSVRPALLSLAATARPLSSFALVCVCSHSVFASVSLIYCLFVSYGLPARSSHFGCW